MKISQAGEAWREYYLGETTTWCAPDRITPTFFARHAQSEWITKMLQYVRIAPMPGTRILEAGCGTAQYALTLALLGYDVEAFDYSAEALSFARKLEAIARQVNANLNFKLALGNLLEIQSADNVYDLVFNQGVIDYFIGADERRQALSEMMRVTKPGGWVAVIAQHTAHPFRGWWERLGWEGYTHQPPIAIQTPVCLQRELKEIGLSNVQSDGIYPWKAFFFYPAWHRRWRVTEEAVYLLGRVLDRTVSLPRAWRAKLAVQFLVVGQKT